MSSSSTTPQEAQSEKASPSFSPMARKGFRTLSRARLKELLSQSKLRREKEKQAQNNLTSLPGSKTAAASPSLPLASMTLWQKYKLLPKAIWLWVTHNLII